MPGGLGKTQQLVTATDGGNLDNLFFECRGDYGLVIDTSNGIIGDVSPAVSYWKSLTPRDVYFIDHPYSGSPGSPPTIPYNPIWEVQSSWLNGINAWSSGPLVGWTNWFGTCGTGPCAPDSGYGQVLGQGAPPTTDLGHFLGPPIITPTVTGQTRPDIFGWTWYWVCQFENVSPLWHQGIVSQADLSDNAVRGYDLCLLENGQFQFTDCANGNFPSTDYYQTFFQSVGSMSSPGVLMFQVRRNGNLITPQNPTMNMEWNGTPLSVVSTNQVGSTVPFKYTSPYGPGYGPSIMQSGNLTFVSNPRIVCFRGQIGHIICCSSYHGAVEKAKAYAYFNRIWGV